MDDSDRTREAAPFDSRLLLDIMGEWGSNRFGYSYKRAHFTEKALAMANAIGRDLDDIRPVFRAIVEENMAAALGDIGEVELSTEDLVEVQRRLLLYLFSYGFPYGTDFPSAPGAMRAPVDAIARLIDVPFERLYPVWASLVSDSIEWSFEDIPEDMELPNENDWRERRR